MRTASEVLVGSVLVALLAMAPSACRGDGEDPPATETTSPSPTASSDPSTARAIVAKVPIEIRQVLDSTEGPCETGARLVPSTDGTTCYDVGDGLTIERLTAIDVERGQARPVVSVTMSADDAADFADLTTRVHTESAPRNQLAIIVNESVVSAPMVQRPIEGRTFQISGPFTLAEAERLVTAIVG